MIVSKAKFDSKHRFFLKGFAIDNSKVNYQYQQAKKDEKGDPVFATKSPYGMIVMFVCIIASNLLILFCNTVLNVFQFTLVEYLLALEY